MNTYFESNFVVMPNNANYMFPMIFGGAFFSEMDLCAANAVKRFLYDSETCSNAVTHKFEGKFLQPCYVGDLIFLEAKIISSGKKSIVVEVKAFREKSSKRTLVAEAKFVFITISDISDVSSKPNFLPYKEHGLSTIEGN